MAENEAEPNASEGVIFHSLSQRKVVRYGDKVVKFSPDIHSSEAETMKFIAANTSIPVPRVYATSTHPIPSITMDYIEGDQLDKVWKGLSEEQKLAIIAQLRAILSELRSLKGSYIGSLHHQRAIDVRRLDIEGGPFETESAFNSFLLSGLIQSVPKILREIASHALQEDHEILFTHGDFALRNIMIRDGKVVGILDWEYSGWYPEYWEFVKTFNAMDRRIDWYDYVGIMFPKCYEKEYINHLFLGSLSRH